MNNSELVYDIYYFGSLSGYDCYPPTNKFSGYFNNLNKDWLLSIRCDKGCVKYVYVKYGLLTSGKDPRTGSCFGLAFSLKDIFFTDVNILHDFFENAVNIMVDENKLLKIVSEKQIGFVPPHLINIESYLIDWNGRIRSFISNLPDSNFCRLSGKKCVEEGRIAKMHLQSDPAALYESFCLNGGVDISPNFLIEKYSLEQKKSQNKLPTDQENKDQDKNPTDFKEDPNANPVTIKFKICKEIKNNVKKFLNKYRSSFKRRLLFFLLLLSIILSYAIYLYKENQEKYSAILISLDKLLLQTKKTNNFGISVESAKQKLMSAYPLTNAVFSIDGSRFFCEINGNNILVHGIVSPSGESIVIKDEFALKNKKKIIIDVTGSKRDGNIFVDGRLFKLIIDGTVVKTAIKTDQAEKDSEFINAQDGRYEFQLSNDTIKKGEVSNFKMAFYDCTINSLCLSIWAQ